MRLLLLLLFAGTVLAGPGSGRPRHNSSFVPDDDEETRSTVASVRDAVRQGEWSAAARLLDRLLASTRPAVVAVRGRELFVSPRRWATLTLLGDLPPAHPELLEAWRRIHDADANRALAAALAAGDERGVERLLRRYPAAADAADALLALTDRALLRREGELAQERLDRFADHLTATEALALRQSPAWRSRVEHLRALEPPARTGWPTFGGNAARSRTGDAAPDPAATVLRWQLPILEEPPRYPDLISPETRKQSLRLPFYPVCDERHLYLHMGTAVRVIRRDNGKLVAQIPPDEEDKSSQLQPLVVDSMLAETPGMRAATLHGGLLYFNRLAPQHENPQWSREAAIRRTNELWAYDIEEQRIAWKRDDGVFFRGAPAVYGDRLYVYGAKREMGAEGPTRKEEGYLFCLRLSDGALVWQRFLCYGDSDAPADFPPLSGLAPAVSRGVVAVVTGLGAAAALDARTGEVLWLYRYDRVEPRARVRLQDIRERYIPERSQWAREPPRIVGDRVLFAPFDSEMLYACRLRGGRDRDGPQGGFAVVLWEKHRTRLHQNSVLEYFGGVHDDRVLCIGRRDLYRASYSYETVVAPKLRGPSAGGLFVYGRIPVGRRHPRTGAPLPPELYGRPAVAGSVLLVPTSAKLFRFDLRAVTAERTEAGEVRREFGELEPYTPPPAPEGAPPAAPDQAWFGTTVTAGGWIYCVSLDRLFCYGPRK